MNHETYFRRQLADDNDEFFARFRSEPDWGSRRVLDVGCGHGALSVRAAQRGAAFVLGVDVAGELVEFARENLTRNYPELASRVTFICGDVGHTQGRFDLVVSKDTFEHVLDVPRTLALVRDRLKPGGEIWVGFSPLFYSPFGDHGRTGMLLPWAHCLPWAAVRRCASRARKRQVLSLGDIGLNGMTPAAFRRAVESAGLAFRSIRYNPGRRRLMPALRALRRLPGMERFGTVGIYAILTPSR